MKIYFLLSISVLQCIQLTQSFPGLGPAGSEDPGDPYGVPHHTTQGFVKRQIKNLYNLFFKKEESVHQDGYTQVHVMGKHMYYTYTHEYTNSKEKYYHPEDDRIKPGSNTIDPMQKYLKDDGLIKQRDQEVDYHRKNKKRLEEESVRQMKQGWTPATDFVPPDLKIDNTEENLGTADENEPNSNEGGIFKKIKSKIEKSIFGLIIPHLNRKQRDLREKRSSDNKESEDGFKAKLKNMYMTVMGKAHSRIRDNLKEVIKKQVKKVPSLVGTAASHVVNALGNVVNDLGGKIADHVGIMGKNAIPIEKQNSKWKEYRDQISNKIKDGYNAIKNFEFDIVPEPVMKAFLPKKDILD